MTTMTDRQFLEWLAERLVHQYGENENVDFLHRLRSIAESQDEVTVSPPNNSRSERTSDLVNAMYGDGLSLERAVDLRRMWIDMGVSDSSHDIRLIDLYIDKRLEALYEKEGIKR